MKENNRLQPANREPARSHGDSSRPNVDAERSGWLWEKVLSTLNHELRTPLNAVLGFSELLSEERAGPLNERQRRYVGHIHNGGQQLLRLINDILDYSKIEAGRLQLVIDKVPIQSSVAEVFGALQPLAERNSQTLAQNSPSDLVVRADATRFKQVLQHLVANAIKFSPEKAKVEVTATQLGEFARIEIRDSGPGIPKEEQGRIFDAFYRLGRADQAQTGIGLGLAIAKRLIEMQGGNLGVESEPGSGSCFYFTMPIVSANISPLREHGTDQIERKTPSPKPVQTA